MPSSRRASPPSSTSSRRRRNHGRSGHQRAWLLLLLPALLVLLVLLCGPAARVNAAPASDAAGAEKHLQPQQQELDQEPELEIELEGGDRGLGEGDAFEDVDDAGDLMGAKGKGGRGPGQQRPTFNFLQVRSRAELEKEGFQCFPTGECLECTMEEMAQPYCTATQRREEVTCEREETVRSGVEAQKKLHAVTTYETCYATAGDDMTSMLRFQALMAVLGGLALYGVRHQKLKHQTLYERRQVGRNRRRGGYSGI